MRVARLCPIRLSLLAVWCVAASASPVFAQVAAGEITGVVKDQAGAAVPGATVTVTNVDTNRQRVVASSGEGVHRAEPGAGRLPRRRRAVGLQAGAARRHPSLDRRKGADRLRPRRRRRARTGDGDGGRPDPSRRDREPRDRRRARAGRAAAAERPHVHHARVARPRRRAAAQLAAAPHQRRASAHERIPLRRHLRAAAGAGPGGVLSGDRRDSGVQDREQQSARRVRPLQRRRREPHHQGRRERLSRRRIRVPPQRGAQREELLSVDESR